MRDAQTAMILAMLGYIPILLSAILYIILGTPPVIEYSMVIIGLAIGGVLYTMIFSLHPRVQHYREALRAFDRIYLYVEKAEAQ